MSKSALPMFAHLRRLVWWCVLPLALALVAAAASLMFLAHQRQLVSTQHRVDDMAAEVNATLALHIQGLKALAVVEAEATSQRSLAQLHAKAVSYQKAIGFPVLLTDGQRRIWLSSARNLGEALPGLPTPAGPSALDAALQSGNPRVGNMVFGPIANQEVIPIIVPAGELAGGKAWLTILPAKLWQRRLDEESIAAGWNVVLLDGNGKLIAGRGPGIVSAGEPPPGGRRFTAAVGLAPWTAVVYASPWTFFQPQLQLAALLVAVLAVVAKSVTWLAQRLSAKLSTAVVALTNQGPEPRSPTRSDLPVLRVLEIDAVHHELRRLRSAHMEAEARERERVARDLHDGLQQTIASVKLMVDLLRQRNDQTPDATQMLDQASRGTQLAIKELHHIINALRPPALDELGLLEAVEQLAHTTADLTGLVIEVEPIADPEALYALPASVADCVFRLVQECLNNVRKHAQASFVHIVIDLSDPRRLVIQVSDDGVGIEMNAPARQDSFGQTSMRQRVTALRGTLDVRRGHQDDQTRGTTVIATVPIDVQQG